MAATETQTSLAQRTGQLEGITVVGEAVRRLTPEHAEFLIEVTSSGSNAAQVLRENHNKTHQVSQALAPVGVQGADVHSISMNVQSLYAPVPQPLPFAAAPQIGPGAFQPFAPQIGMQTAPQPELQLGAYVARNVLRVKVRESARLGEVVDAASRTGATVLGGFAFKVADEAQARRAALEAAGKDAREKAEALAASAGKQIGELAALSEDLIASNGAYAALRAAVPFAFGAGAPPVIGELEYYARVSANFRLR
jgi:uncharacterized protein YggE